MASAGTYASLHLSPGRQPCQHHTTQFLHAGCLSCRPANSVKALLMLLITNCCSSHSSTRLHSCWHLPNKLEHIDRIPDFFVVYSGPGDAPSPKLPLLLGDLGRHLMHGSLDHPNKYPRGTLISSAVMQDSPSRHTVQASSVEASHICTSAVIRLISNVHGFVWHNEQFSWVCHG